MIEIEYVSGPKTVEFLTGEDADPGMPEGGVDSHAVLHFLGFMAVMMAMVLYGGFLMSVTFR